MKINFRSLIIIASLVANGFALIHWVKNRPTKEACAREEIVVTISVAPVLTETLARKSTYPGTLYAQKSASLISDIQGRIKSIHFKKGERVKKGQLLIQLHDEQPLAELNEVKALLHASEMALKRQKALGSLSTLAALEKAQADRDVNKAKLENAQARMKSTRITAPFDGVIGLMTLTEGAQVNPNQELTKIVSQGSFTVQFQIPEADSLHLKIGQKIELYSKDYASTPVTAHITAIEPYSDQTSHTVKVEALLDTDVKQHFHDGSYAKVEISLEKTEDALTVPKEALLTIKDESFVFILSPSGDKVSARAVFQGITQGDRVEIREGVKVGDLVALDPDDHWSNPQSVKVDNPQSPISGA